MVTDLIVYAHPTGELAQQIEQFFQASRQRFGPNNAHNYPVHCSLTGFFHDEPDSIRVYVEALQSALLDAQRASSVDHDFDVLVERLCLEREWMGLELSCLPLVRLTEAFVAKRPSLARVDELRVKDELHVSVAYGFDHNDREPIATMAREMISPFSPAQWNIGLWERRVGNAWCCHWSVPLTIAFPR